jgi:hypothetical protein
MTATRFCAAALAVAVVLGLVAQAAAEGLCRPILSVNDVQLSPISPPTLVRKWTAVVAVDASRCKTNLRGSFEIVFTRLSETAPDMEFRERFTWEPPSVRVSLDFGRDEAVKHYRVDNVSPCVCRD